MKSFNGRRRRNGKGLPQSLFGKIGLTLFILVWLALPVTALVMASRNALENSRIKLWMEVPCTFESVKADGDDGRFRLSVRYAYEVDGVRHVGTRYSVSQGNDVTVDGIARRNELLDRYAEGASGTCFVNASDAAQSVLVRENTLSREMLVFFIMGGLFLCVGCGFLSLIWRKDGPSKSSASSIEPTPLTDATASPESKRPFLADFIVPAFGTVFLLVGIILGGFMARTLWHNLHTAWGTATGTVISSTVRVSHSSKSTTYHPYVVYRYTVDEHEYENDVLSKPRTSIGNHAAVERHAARYRPGADVEVLYNPDNPSESFLERSGFSDYVMLAFPLLFTIAGAVMLVCGLRVLLPRSAVPSYETPLTGQRLKRAANDEAQKVFFTAMWCTFTFTFVAIWFTAGEQFSWTWEFWTFDKFFVLIFPLCGVGFIVSCVRGLIRRLRTGRYDVEISCDRLRPGARVQVTYRFHGNTSRFHHVVFAVEQQNIAYQRTARGGGDPYAKRRDNVWSGDGPVVQQGTFVFTLPPRIEGRRIVWRLVLKFARLTDVFRLDVED
jgi:hypothetical protein